MGAFAVVARDEDFAFGDDDVNFTGCMGFGPIGVGGTREFVGVKAVREFIVEDREGAVLDLNSLAGEADDTLDDVLVFDAWGGFAGEDVAIATVGEDDDLPALWGEFLTREV